MILFLFFTLCSASCNKDFVCKSLIADQLDWHSLSSNEHAILLLYRYLHKVNWQQLELNPKASMIISRFKSKSFHAHTHELSWKEKALLPSAMNWIHIVPPKHSNTFWYYASANPVMVPWLSNHSELIHWDMLSSNPNALPLLESHMELVNWSFFSANPSAMEYLMANIHKVDWTMLSMNPNMTLLHMYPDRVHWFALSNNPNGLPWIFKMLM